MYTLRALTTPSHHLRMQLKTLVLERPCGDIRQHDSPQADLLMQDGLQKKWLDELQFATIAPIERRMEHWRICILRELGDREATHVAQFHGLY